MKKATVKNLKTAMELGEKLLRNGIDEFTAVLDRETGRYTVSWEIPPQLPD